MPRRDNSIVGKRFGYLLVISRFPAGQKCTCKCDCGNEYVGKCSQIKSGKTRSCGCLREEIRRSIRRVHGHARKNAPSSTYRIWAGMISRCTLETNQAFERYGAAGISVEERWMEFENFLSDMGERPPGMSLDRIDNKAGYSRENCRWATIKQQARNKKNNRIIRVGEQEKTAAEWAEVSGIKSATIRYRLSQGMSPQLAISQPVKPTQRKSTCPTP